MAFNEIKTVEDHKFYSDLAFRKSKERSKQISKDRVKGKKKEDRLKIKFEVEINVFSDVLISKLKEIVETFPRVNGLNDYYKELLSLYVDVVDYKKSLYKIKWSAQKINEFKKIYLSKLKRAGNEQNIRKVKKEFIGRVNSILKSLKKEFLFLKECRKVFVSLPRIKEMFTVIIGGFPNVGKSTLLSKLSSSKPEINNYPFTTKHINIGYLNKKIQLIDTPGTLNRKEKMNNIEYQAYLTAKYYGDFLLFVIDAVEGYEFVDQIKLFKRFKREYLKKGVDFLIYVSKSDLVDKKRLKEVVEEISKRANIPEEKIVWSIEGVKRRLKELDRSN